MNRGILCLMVSAALTLCASVHAAPLPPATHCLPPPHPADLAVTDVMFGTIAASDCYGVVQASSNSASTIGFDNFAPLLVDAVPNGAAVTNSLDGVTFSLGVTYAQSDPANLLTIDQSSGSWTLAWTGGTAPITLDIVAVLQTPNTFVSYFFNDLVLAATPGSGAGSWALNYLFNEDIPTLSSVSIYASSANSPTPPTSVDEPASVALLGVAVLGFGLARRRFARI